MIDNILFDLDGTLVDSADDIIDCLSRAYAVRSIELPSAIHKSLIGPPLRDIVRLITPELDENAVDLVIREFRYCYDASRMERTGWKEGARDTLSFLSFRKKTLFLVTNKPRKPTDIIINNLKISMFCDIITPDMRPGSHLSKPEMISHVKKKWNLGTDKTMMVGDTASDAFAARDNGIMSAIVLNGYGDRVSIQNSRPGHILDSLAALKNIVVD